MRPSKRDELVQKALAIFYRNGFHATGMDMLAQASGISKTSMYNHFRTKDELILAVLRLRDEKFRNWLYRRMEQLALSPRDQLIAMFDALSEWFEEPDFQGCMFIKASSEYQDPASAIYKHCTDHKLLIQKHLETLSYKAGADNAAKLSDQLILLKEGAIIAAHLGILNKPAQSAKETASVLVDLAVAH